MNDKDMTLPTIASLWVGDSLTLIEQICIQSFLDHGHRFILYIYSPVTGAPEGTVLADANEIMPAHTILRYSKEQSPALHANLFRYAMLAQTDYIWADVDMLALRPFDFVDNHVFGWQSEAIINNAVLRLPADSPALKKLRRFTPDSWGVDPTVKRWKKRAKIWLRTGGRGTHITDWRWGATGPLGLTNALDKSGEIRLALPCAAFYPVGFREVDDVLRPDGLAQEQIEPETYGVHLWGKFLRRTIEDKYQGHIPEDGFIGRAITRYLNGDLRPVGQG